MVINKYITNYFLFLFSIIPLSILLGSAISVGNIILIDLSFVVLIIYTKNFFFLKDRSIKYLLLLYIYLIFNSFISINFYEGVLRNFGFLRMIILFAAFNYFFIQSEFFKKVFKFWILTMLILLLDVFIESFTGQNILGYGDPTGRRILTFFKDEAIVGGYLNAFYLIIVGFLLNELKEKKFLFASFVIILFILAIILTGERSNSIKAILGLSFFLFFIKTLDLRIKLALISTIIVLIFFSLINSEYLKNRFINQIYVYLIRDNKENVYFRLYSSGFEVFKNNKIFGVGNKNYRVVSCNKEDDSKNKKVTKYFCNTHPHQIYLELLSEHGIVGIFMIFFILYKLIFSKIMKTLNTNNYMKLGALIYMVFVFTPLLPSGAFFNNYLLTIFIINLSIFYASDRQLNIFNRSK